MTFRDDLSFNISDIWMSHRWKFNWTDILVLCFWLDQWVCLGIFSFCESLNACELTKKTSTFLRAWRKMVLCPRRIWDCLNLTLSVITNLYSPISCMCAVFKCNSCDYAQWLCCNVRAGCLAYTVPDCHNLLHPSRNINIVHFVAGRM